MHTPEVICQRELALHPWMDPSDMRLPGLKPIPVEHWLCRDDVYAAQMAYKDQLIAQNREAVFTTANGATDLAAAELLEYIVKNISRTDDFKQNGQTLQRPDSVGVDLTEDHPLVIAGRLVQEDFCLLDRRNGTHVLTAGLVCFPTSWTLSEKIGRSLTSLHGPVDAFDNRLALRLERIFHMLQPGTVLMRGNTLIYTDPDLHQPRRENEARPIEADLPRWVRVERQTLRRLPQSEAIVFGIHTSLVPAETLPDKAFKALAKLKPELTLGVSA